MDIIGQFGVGFYSAFMVADKVTVITGSYGATTGLEVGVRRRGRLYHRPCEKDTVGTDIILHIKADTEEEYYASSCGTGRIQGLVKKYSDYIRYPIRMEMQQPRHKEGTGEDDKPEYETSRRSGRPSTTMVPMWQRPRAEVTKEEYNELLQEQVRGLAGPQSSSRASAEGAVTYKALLFIPGSQPHASTTPGL